MESFFDFIFGNMFILIIIIGAVINLLGKGKQAEEQKQPPVNKQRPPQDKKVSPIEKRYEQLREKAREMERTIQGTIQETIHGTDADKYEQQVAEAKESTMETLEESQQALYDRLKDQYQTKHDADDLEATAKYLKAMENQETLLGQKASKGRSVHLQRNLNRQGLIDSIVMAEVLGPPRALKPYRNIAEERRR